MTLDRKDYKSAIPQLEGRLEQIEKLGKDVFNKFEDIAHKTQLDAAEAEKKVLSLDYKMTTTRVQMEYQLQTTGLDPVEANWQTTMPSITYSSYQGKTLWYRSKTYVNDIIVQTTEPMTVNLMDGVYSFVNTVSGNTGWTTIDGDTIQTGKITSHNGYCYFDIDNNNFQMKDNSTLASSTSALAWDDGQLYIKGKIAIGNSTTDKKYYTEMTGGGFDIVANNETLAHIGYASGTSETGTATAPYYTLGTRVSDSSGYRGNYSVAEGKSILASGYCSHAQNCATLAQWSYQTAIGLYNKNVSTNLFEIGNGISARSNAFAVDFDGVVRLAGNLFTGCNSDSTGGYEFGRKTGNHIVVGGIHICWGRETISHTGSGYKEVQVTLPYTYTSAPYCFASYGNRPTGGAARTAYATQSDLAGNKIYVGSYATGSVTAYVNWMTIGV